MAGPEARGDGEVVDRQPGQRGSTRAMVRTSRKTASKERTALTKKKGTEAPATTRMGEAALGVGDIGGVTGGRRQHWADAMSRPEAGGMRRR